MGQHGLAMLLAMAGLAKFIDRPPPDNLSREFDFAAMAAMNMALEEMYGPRGGRGIALRIGRASFAQGIRRFGVMRGIQDPAFRSLPRDHRVELGLMALASIFTHFSDQASSVQRNARGELSFHVESSPMAWGRSSDKPVCHALSGVIHESLLWSANGYACDVREVACSASGADHCVFHVNKAAAGEVC